MKDTSLSAAVRAGATIGATLSGMPYWAAAANRCGWIADNSNPYDVKVCGEPPAFAGCSWCEAHRRIVFVRFSRQARPRVQAIEAIAA